MKYETLQDKVNPEAWRVEAIDLDGDGACYVTIFSGPDAEERATEYANWKNGAGQSPATAD